MERQFGNQDTSAQRVQLDHEEDSKQCTICEVRLPIKAFSKAKYGRNGLLSYCRSCRRVYRKAKSGMPASVTPLELKTCTGCHDLLPLTSFTVNRSRTDKLSAKCRSCLSNYQSSRRRQNPKHFKNRDAATRDRYRAKNRAKIRQPEKCDTFWCSRCKTNLPSELFSKNLTRSTGMAPWCRECNVIGATRWRKSHPQQYKQSRNVRNKRNAESIRRQKKQWNRRTRSNDPEYGRVAKRKYHIEHLEQSRANLKKWRASHRENRILEKQRRRARILGAINTLTLAQWTAIKKYYCYSCLWCRGKEPDVKLSMDHVVPLALGGAHAAFNIQPLCVRCNSIKRDRILDFRPIFTPHHLLPP